VIVVGLAEGERDTVPQPAITSRDKKTQPGVQLHGRDREKSGSFASPISRSTPRDPAQHIENRKAASGLKFAFFAI